MTPPPLPHNAPAGYDRLLSLEGWKLENGILRADILTGSGGTATATFQALTPSIWRFTFAPGGVKAPGPMIAMTPGAGVPLRADEDGEGITVTGPRLPLRLGRKAWSVAFIDKKGGDVWRENPTAIDGLACTIRGGLSAGMSGIPFWSNDIGGYRGTPGEELYIRWAQFGLLCSHSRMHGDSPREPWQFGERALTIVRDFIKLRYRLIPYIYSCAHEASETGLPVLRGLPIAYPDDPNVYDKDLEFMLGPWFLVVPAFDRSETRNVYIPGGTWFNYWNGARVEGPRTLRVDLPMETVPLFVRDGAIIPMAAHSMRVPAGPLEALTLEVCPGGGSEYTFREDGGVTQIRCTALDSRITFGWEGPIERETTVRFNGLTRMIGPQMTLDGRGIGTDMYPPVDDGRGLIMGIPRSRSGILQFGF
jgi:hypothetical protein